jgi:hypothetical protein
MDTQLEDMQVLDTLSMPEQRNTTMLSTRNWLLDDSVYTPRINWGSFHAQSAIVPADREQDFRSGKLVGSYVELHFMQQNSSALHLIIVGDTVIGRDGTEINLEDQNAQELGVSRKHIMLRPTNKHLYLMDLGSMNGTLLNGVLISPSRAYPLGGRDVITLGKLTFTLNVMGIGKSTLPITEPNSEGNPFV